MWQPEDYCFKASPDIDSVARQAYATTCRTTLNSPGFCVISVDDQISSQDLRAAMVQLKEHLSLLHFNKTGRRFVWESMARFDQQEPTKLHRDNGPEESVLILGYEPSAIRSEFAIADYSRCASDRGVSPQDLLETHNPMFQQNAAILDAYTTRIHCFSHDRPQIIVVNNSAASLSESSPRLIGVLHTAVVLNPSDAARRVINSTQIAVSPPDATEKIPPVQVTEFVTTTVVRRRGYDKTHLRDD